ncbi:MULTISPECIES: amino acid ABC transporter permease [Helicobacter]|uniref:Amino acid ABC transporter permease n=1 Tax=Helicobacter ibis TaxID=2962633 RepID=A0ABT4VDN5_9HELI|nr:MULTISPECIES: amino acid ABC transporter permease [Helicobacter]MDA3966579.1 amino acid ABC transporter permease [Helicobacter sp. WB40]MDA3968805.1 amino acid ABC transporter permease [Helicobacter ibis]
MEILFDTQNIARILEGVFVTFQIAFIAIFFSIIFGFILGYLMTLKICLINFICRIYLESIRIIPILAWLFIVYFGFSSFLNLSGIMSCILVFSLWGIAEMGDLVRGAISSLPKHQSESGRALGLSEMQIQIFIILPQSIKRLMPSLVNLFTRMIKTTSLAALIGVSDMLKVGQQIIEVNLLSYPQASFWIYGGIFFIYFILCYPLSIYSKYLEKKYI